jgi:hypothetical protein
MDAAVNNPTSESDRATRCLETDHLRLDSILRDAELAGAAADFARAQREFARFALIASRLSASATRWRDPISQLDQAVLNEGRSAELARRLLEALEGSP